MFTPDNNMIGCGGPLTLAVAISQIKERRRSPRTGATAPTPPCTPIQRTTPSGDLSNSDANIYAPKYLLNEFKNGHKTVRVYRSMVVKFYKGGADVASCATHEYRMAVLFANHPHIMNARGDIVFNQPRNLTVLRFTNHGFELNDAINRGMTVAQKVANWSDSLPFRNETRNVVSLGHGNFSRAESYTLGINEYADLTDTEFHERFLTGYLSDPRDRGYTSLSNPHHYTHDPPTRNGLVHKMASVDWSTTMSDRADLDELPASVDWSKAMSGIKNQGGCGSCYAFSAIETIEGHYFIKHGKHRFLSEGEIIDCSIPYHNMRCEGGWPTSVFAYVKDHGVCPVAEYPYSIPFQFCQRSGACQKHDRTFITAFHTIDGQSDEDNIVRALQDGPVSIAIAANDALQFYKRGIFSGCDETTRLNHAVVAIGYDEHSFLVQNSWGDSWGDWGIFKLPRHAVAQDVACGLRGAPATVTV
ncbi:hypothetical protein SARC_04056 [Sphaeroforma arctica JP610]|uniref:Peptidase C1A papain C-terminal domain-containing protein n=1 Tax=Sphaeroforma arctica JP610 TaxID=667725 RepID=A0A0L0G3L4_9EUKA|nr:hypothetical protein SARC_04056 [Sphaeroforma arctica JP610]KNC83697.1 hypothetical protein SARC_04056 [Sphaeroforma arctica JP610]|eukprot:XP_014157599.1 hypothetical protein SARC_04056 [Sphaeroforma arctica JP610]